MNISVILDGQTLPDVSLPFIKANIENATDVVTLDGSIYTDFVNFKRQWKLRWDEMHEDDYAVLRNIYDSQFTDNDFPTLTINYYGITDVPVRMYINDQDIHNDGCWILGVEVTLTEETAV